MMSMMLTWAIKTAYSDSAALSRPLPTSKRPERPPFRPPLPRNLFLKASTLRDICCSSIGVSELREGTIGIP